MDDGPYRAPPTGPLDQKLAELQIASDGLRATGDKLTAAIAAFQDKLTAARPGVEAWIDLKPWPNSTPDGDTGWEFGYKKVSGHWRLMVQQEGQPMKRIGSAPRPVRLVAMSQAGRLVDELVRRVKALRDGINKLPGEGLPEEDE